MPPMVKPKYLLCPKCEYDVGPSIAAGHELCPECGTALRITAQDDYGKPPPRATIVRAWLWSHPEVWILAPGALALISRAVQSAGWPFVAGVFGVAALVALIAVSTLAATAVNMVYFGSSTTWRYILIYVAIFSLNAVLIILLI